MRISYHTFGCRLNRAETLQDQADAVGRGDTVVDTDENADVIVVRACSITARAERDCRKFISRLQENYPDKVVRVTGCLPGVKRKTNEEKTVLPVSVPMSTARAYLKVQDGCSGRCTFCIVPQFRGAPVSISFPDVMKSASSFIEAGYRELVVTGCNLSLYRSEGVGLGGLLDKLAKMDRGIRIRLSSYEPCICDESLFDTFQNNQNMCKFLHISLQSASDDVLVRMNRPYNGEQIEKTVSSFREKCGDGVMLGCDVICGFPGESEKDFEITRRFLDCHNFVNVHAFPYSERPGTPAATMDGVIPGDVRHERVRILLEEASARKKRFAETFVGREVEVCVEKSGEESKGWTSEYLPCIIKKTVPRRSLFKGIVTKIEDNELVIDGI